MHMILCGPPLCGKSHYGRQVAEQVKRSFIDTDRLIEQKFFLRAGLLLSCRDIVLQKGEQLFRQLEEEVIEGLREEKEGRVIAIGGGTLMQARNAMALKTMGKLVFLKTGFEVLWERLKKKTTLPALLNPQAPKESFEALIEGRNAVYYSHADVVVDTAVFSEEALISFLGKIFQEAEDG